MNELNVTTTNEHGLGRRIRAWYWAARPFTLSAFLAPVLVGSALAFHDKPFSWRRFVLVLVASLLIQVAANLVDEYSDHSRPEANHKLIAPHKVIALGLLTAAQVKRGAFVCFGAASLIGIYLTLVSGWPIFVAAGLSVLATYFYSGGPKPLGTLGWGQPLVFVFMGPVMVVGSYYVQTGAWTPESLLISLPIASTVTAILACNDLRDHEEDMAAAKATIVTKLGLSFARWELTALIAGAFALIGTLVLTRLTGVFAMLAFLTLPQALVAVTHVWIGKSRPERAVALKAVSKLHALLGILLAIGIAVG